MFCCLLFYYIWYPQCTTCHLHACNVLFLVSSCDQLSCGANEICVSAGDTYECVCHSDYEGENCQAKGPYNIITTSFKPRLRDG
jgi:hypothetical protein